MCHKLDTLLLQGLEKVLETTYLTEMQKPQPMNPELPSWPVSGFLHMLNNFSVNNVLSQTTTVHHAILDDASVMSEDDHPGVSRQPRGWGGRVLWPGELRPSPPGGITGSWTCHSPAGFWGSVKAS